jgi:hypothetical protein
MRVKYRCPFPAVVTIMIKPLIYPDGEVLRSF